MNLSVEPLGATPQWKRCGEKYYDIETGHTVATMSVVIYGKLKEVMVAYDIEEQTVRLLTIHFLKEGQKENRLNSGR